MWKYEKTNGSGTALGAGKYKTVTGENARAAGQRLKTAGPGTEVPVS